VFAGDLGARLAHAPVGQLPVSTPSRAKQPPEPEAHQGRPSVGIQELKARASAIVEDVRNRRVTYAVTKHGAVEALIVSADAGERPLPEADTAWEAWDALVVRLAEGAGESAGSAVEELERMRR
jgi:antitoxin (DNA-binding transcriptional repressor) of toxin-antitoxin stability system